MTWDGVTDQEILDRDRWVCGICRKRIGKTYRYPHPRSASIDHIIPLAETHDDTAANKRAAHLVCNMSRGAGGGNEQLALFGGVAARELETFDYTYRSRKRYVCEGCGKAANRARHTCKGWPQSKVHYYDCARCGQVAVSQRAGRTLCQSCGQHEPTPRPVVYRQRQQSDRPTLFDPRIKHGTTSGYAHRCRCDACTDAQRDYRRDWAARNPEKYREIYERQNAKQAARNGWQPPRAIRT